MRHHGPDKPPGNRHRTSVVSFDNDQTDNAESHDVNIIENHSQHHHQHNITTKLLRIFKSKKWRKNRKDNETDIVIDKPLSFPKVKLRKADNTGEDHLKSSLKISKSLPIRKPVIVWEEIEEFQKLDPEIPESPTNRRVDDTGPGEKISVSTQTDISYGLEQRPKLRRLTASRPQLAQRNEVAKVSLNLTRSSDEDDQCNLEVFQALYQSGSSSQMTGSPRDADGIASTISEMISPTMMMETEVDTDTDTVEECEDRNNIYEEVLNTENYRERNNHSKLSTTSSIYRASWWGRPAETSNSTFQTFQAPITNSVQKSKLCRTANSIHGPHQHRVCNAGRGRGPGDISHHEKGVITKTLSEKFSHLGIRQYSVFKNGK